MLALPQLHHLIPDGELTSIKITRVDASEPLAISIVGGNETPLVRILIQDIYREGVIARDGRLLPGDMILKVFSKNSLTNIPFLKQMLSLDKLRACLSRINNATKQLAALLHMTTHKEGIQTPTDVTFLDDYMYI